MGRLVRCVVVGAAVAGGLAIAAGPALAHVTVQPGTATQGGFATFAFQVPNERDNASTTQLEVEFPADHPIRSVSVEPVAGWTIDVARAPLEEPVEGESGETTEAVSRITWSGGTIPPGEFQRFTVSAGPLPDDTDRLEFAALQTYDNGEVVRWIEASADGAEPEFPAPVLELTPSTGDEHGGGTDAAAASDGEEAASGDDDNGSDTLAIVALVVGGLGLLSGGAALALTRRRTA